MQGAPAPLLSAAPGGRHPPLAAGAPAAWPACAHQTSTPALAPSLLGQASPRQPCPCSQRSALPRPRPKARCRPRPRLGRVESPGQRHFLRLSPSLSPLKREQHADGADVTADGSGQRPRSACARSLCTCPLRLPCQSSVWRKWLVSVLLLCGDSDSVGSVSGDPVSASYCAVEPGCLGSSGFPARERRASGHPAPGHATAAAAGSQLQTAGTLH